MYTVTHDMVPAMRRSHADSIVSSAADGGEDGGQAYLLGCAEEATHTQEVSEAGEVEHEPADSSAGHSQVEPEARGHYNIDNSSH